MSSHVSEKVSECEVVMGKSEGLSKKNSLCVAVWVLMICVMLVTGGCGKKDIEESVAAGSAETSEEQAQTKEASTGTVEAESGSGEAANAESMPEYVTVVRITINPELELYLDGDGKVVAVDYLNEDAENAFSALPMTGINLEEAVKLVVATSVEDGYLTEGKTITVDFVEQKEETDLQNMMETVQTAVQDELSEKQLSATLELGTKGEIQESVALQPEPLEDTQEAAASEPSEKPAEKTASSAQPANSPNPESTVKPSEKPVSAGTPANNPCPECGGTGICPECGGGTLPCKRCGGSLWESCGVCGGDGRQSCPGCHGGGKDATSGESCRHCGGAGSITCELCGGSGGKSCSICNGKGVVSDDCILCHGGKSCTSCGGTGIKK